jgi:hypothetical protein
MCSAFQIVAPKISRTVVISLIAVISAALPGLPTSAQQTPPTAAAQPAPPIPTYTPAKKPTGKAFRKPEAAAAALYGAAKRNDEDELLVILGPDAKGIIHWSDDAAERQERRAEFARNYEQMHRLVKEPDNTVALYVGAENWPLPIPLVQYQGAWYFDPNLGRQEIRYRRIGRNEMETLQVCRTLVDAEKEYRGVAHQYTAKFTSSQGSHDGLYWQSASNATRSPIGPYLARAGVTGTDTTGSQPFHGYYYRISLQAPDDFAIVAFPAEYRSSGVMTFLIKQDGKAYEKDLGAQTATLSNQISPSPVDNSWKPVE